MSIVLQGSTSGSITLQEPAIAGSTVLDLPATSGTVLVGGTQNIPKAALPTGSVLQVIQTVKTDSFSTSSGSLVDVTGFSATITPTSASSKILITYSCFTAGTNGGKLSLVRGSTIIAQGTSGTDNGTSVVFYGYGDGSNGTYSGITFLDSPATTSATTYKIQMKVNAGTSYIGTPASGTYGIPSIITLMEIAA